MGLDMAKCPICNSRKGKRKCKAEDSFICSLCCGETRSMEKCDGCSFYKGSLSRRNYRIAPHFPVKWMANDWNLQDNANVIESAMCQFDLQVDRIINDNIVLRLTELLLDKYHFDDKEIEFANELEEIGFNLIDEAIQHEMRGLLPEDLSRILGTIYRSITRHTNGKREYIEFIHEHVGIRLRKGMRAIPDFISRAK